MARTGLRMKPTFPSPSSLSTRQTTRSGTPDGFAVDLVARVGEAFRSENVESETLMLGDPPNGWAFVDQACAGGAATPDCWTARFLDDVSG